MRKCKRPEVLLQNGTPTDREFKVNRLFPDLSIRRDSMGVGLANTGRRAVFPGATCQKN